MLIRITGTWQTENGQITETWRMSRDSVFRATAFAAAGDMKNPVPEEYIRIVRDGEKTFYEAQVAGQNDEKPVLFRLTGLDTNRMVFTNPDHDFPRKIEYTLESPDRLNAIVSDGSTSGKSITFKYRKMKNPKKVTGIGGIFFKSKDPGGMRDWYRDKLGLATNEYGSLFEFRLSDEPERKGYLQWSPFTENTSYFQPSEKDFMINYRVENLEYLVEELRAGGVTILDSIEVYEYGKFIHILDPENNKIELWEPIEGPFTDNYEGKTTK
jgi:predicted enzyme related to lactoylglutathione lyase